MAMSKITKAPAPPIILYKMTPLNPNNMRPPDAAAVALVAAAVAGVPAMAGVAAVVAMTAKSAHEHAV
jgi:hypothetical protein